MNNEHLGNGPILPVILMTIKRTHLITVGNTGHVTSVQTIIKASFLVLTSYRPPEQARDSGVSLVLSD